MAESISVRNPDIGISYNWTIIHAILLFVLLLIFGVGNFETLLRLGGYAIVSLTFLVVFSLRLKPQTEENLRPGRRHNPDGAGPWNDPSYSHRQLCKFSAGAMESTSRGVDSRPAREAVWKNWEGVGE